MSKQSGNWIPLADYSSKYSVSVSTLRRRIRGKSILFKLDNGKYYIADEPIRKKTAGRKKLEEMDFVEDGDRTSETKEYETTKSTPPQSEGTVFSAATALVEEIKKAYSLILHEKEEMILQLREEISDLKTLVKVLEKENERVSKR